LVDCELIAMSVEGNLIVVACWSDRERSTVSGLVRDDRPMDGDRRLARPVLDSNPITVELFIIAIVIEV
jgi:hypothetical protein